MDFSSDTSAPAHPAVLAALAEANAGQAASYGADDVTLALLTQLKAVFETDDLSVWPVASGTASNALALSAICPPTASIMCHREAHIERDERGAPEFFTGGAKLHLLDGHGAQISPETLESALSAIDPGFVHETPPAVVSLTNLSECGLAYTPDDVSALAQIAKSYGQHLHLDGARLANALVSTGATPAEMSWRAGVDVLTLGLTKTGAMGCELIIAFGDTAARMGDLRARAKRSGHMPPKLRYLSAQALALLENDLWLTLARQANQRAQDLAAALTAHADISLAYRADGNEVFAHLPAERVSTLQAAGARFYPWPGGSHRFVCSWTTPPSAVSDLAAHL